MLSNLSPLLIGITLILVLSASMSTLSSLVLTSSSTLTLDFISPFMMKKTEKKEKKELIVIRAFIDVFIIISAVLAIVQYKMKITFIAQLMGLSWGALAGSFLAPFLYSLYWKKVTKASCAVCFVWGSGLMIANMFFKSVFPAFLQSPITCGAAAMLGGLIIVPIVSLFTPKTGDKKVKDVFSCYERTVTVPVTETLESARTSKN